jgi:D-alanyl-lipoteichoic acid acyltransferase DltB (MBOAT superfamily)
MSNLAILFFFKYFTELYDHWKWIEARTSIIGLDIEHILLPLGISFYTLQSMGYTIDVYKKEIKAERHFGYFALYVSFFPQLVAGPIERAKDLLPQLHKPASITTDKIISGLFLIGFGLFKKLIIADRLFVLLNESLSSSSNLQGWQALSFGTLAFLAVYMDISAYTDIARGSARLFGIELSINFKKPMLAKSLGEFWQRWHISLSSWIMNYVFKPLAQLNRSKIHRNFSLIITFLIIGLWHGPTLPVILMGALHGCVIVLERLFASNGYKWPKSKTFNVLRIIRTHIFINISGVLFLSPPMSVAMDIYSQIFNYDFFINQKVSIFQLHGYSFFPILFGGLIITMVVDKLKSRISIINRLSAYYRYGLLYIIFFIAIAFGERTSDEFFYFIF